MGFFAPLIYIILSFTVGPFFVGLALNLITINTIFVYLEKEILSNFSLRLVFVSIGMIIILFCLRYIQTIFRRSQKDKSITFESSEGSASVTLLAIEDMLKKSLEERNEITHVKPKIFLRKKEVEIIIKSILTTEVNLVNFTKEIQKIVKKKMHTLLGEDKHMRIKLEIRKVALGGKKESVEEEEPEIPFRNYE